MGSKDPGIQLKDVAKYLLCLFAGSLDPWIPGSLDFQNWNQETLSVRLCLYHFLLDPWILGSHKPTIPQMEQKTTVSFLVDPWILRSLDPLILQIGFKILSVSLFAGSMNPWNP